MSVPSPIDYFQIVQIMIANRLLGVRMKFQISSLWPKNMSWSKKQTITTKRGKTVNVEAVKTIPREANGRYWNHMAAQAQSTNTSPAVTSVEVTQDSDPGK
jgi:hypothetical protein